ncbi:MAG TPA: hypothetical protein VLB27_10465, partial [candidate division Zixibacteria bacterium]|nr:hypothetical protein [candidate division Zixibacteria bacterium]
LTATVVSPTTVDLTWHAQPGLRYRVYRRIATNNSTYRRLDDPSGNLATVGVAAPPFTDATSDGASLYSYIIIAEDSLGRWSAHSAEAVVDASGPACACDTHGDPSGDGVVNVLDVVALINVAFRGGTDIPDPNSNCPVTTTDCDCSGLTNVIDAVRMVEVAFRGGDAAAEFCDPCAP